jgi:hypothetical protein
MRGFAALSLRDLQAAGSSNKTACVNPSVSDHGAKRTCKTR